MRKSLFALLATAVVLGFCVGCAAAPGTKEAGKQDGAQNEAPVLTEEQIGKIVAQFAGVRREHAMDVWEANLKWEQATVEFEAYMDNLRRFGKNDMALLSAAIRTHREAKKLLEPLCTLYPHNGPLNSMDDVIKGGLNSLLETQRRSAAAGAAKSP